MNLKKNPGRNGSATTPFGFQIRMLENSAKALPP